MIGGTKIKINLKEASYSKGPGKVDDRCFRRRINWRADIGIDTDDAADVDNDSTLATSIRTQISLSKQSTAYYSIL